MKCVHSIIKVSLCIYKTKKFQLLTLDIKKPKGESLGMGITMKNKKVYITAIKGGTEAEAKFKLLDRVLSVNGEIVSVLIQSEKKYSKRLTLITGEQGRKYNISKQRCVINTYP